MFRNLKQAFDRTGSGTTRRRTRRFSPNLGESAAYLEDRQLLSAPAEGRRRQRLILWQGAATSAQLPGQPIPREFPRWPLRDWPVSDDTARTPSASEVSGWVTTSVLV